MRAVIYARYSSSNQRDESIEGQIRECTDYANRNGFSVVKPYINRAKSARSDARPAFQQMIKESSRHLFDIVIVWKLDRFSRDRYDAAHYKQILKKNGVTVVSAKENITDDPSGILLESLLEGMAEHYSSNLSQNVKRGFLENALKCKTTGGYTPLGYKVSAEKGYEIDENKAPIVRKIFSMYDSGETFKTIREELNRLNIKTAQGNEFSRNSFHSILHNKKYIGVYEGMGIRKEGGIPAIIDKELFDRVQRKLALDKKKAAKRTTTVDYMLTGKVFCGLCNSTMAGESGTGKHGEMHHYYLCSARKRYKTCSSPAVRKRWLEETVVKETIKYVLNPEKREYIVRRCLDIGRKQPSKSASNLEMLKRQFKDNKKAIKNLLKAIEDGNWTNTTTARIRELELNQETLEMEIARLEVSTPVLNESFMLAILEEFAKISEVMSREKVEHIIKLFVHSVHVREEKLLVTYYLLDDGGDFLQSEFSLCDFDKKKRMI